MNKLMYTFVTTTKKKKKKEIDPFLDTVCPLRASRVKKKEIDPFLDTVCPFRASRVKIPVTRYFRLSEGLTRQHFYQNVFFQNDSSFALLLCWIIINFP